MPIDSILVSAAVVTVFMIFAAFLIHADLQTGSTRQPPGPGRKRRSF